MPALYTAVIVNDNDIEGLASRLDSILIEDEKLATEGWLRTQKGPHGHEQLNHHCTIMLGAAKDNSPVKEALGKPYSLNIDGFGIDSKKGVAAWRVANPPFVTKAKTPHITAMLGGGKPHEAGNITEWRNIEPFTVNGILMEQYPVGETHVALHHIALRIASIRLDAGVGLEPLVRD